MTLPPIHLELATLTDAQLFLQCREIVAERKRLLRVLNAIRKELFEIRAHARKEGA